MASGERHDIHPYYRTILDAYAASGRPFYHQVTPAEAREMLRSSLVAAAPQTDLPPMASVTDETVAGRACPIAIRRYKAEGNTRGACLYFHAGGWVIGDLDTADPLCRRLAALAGCEIVSVDYRLAPEHPFPAALDDACDVLDWAAAEFSGPMVVAGESAGGNLAASCAIRARDGQGPAIAGQFLAYPITDHDFGTGSYREVGACNYLLSEADMRWFWDHYCPPSVDRMDPLVSPLRVENTAALPPALVYVTELDPLRDEGLSYAEHLAAGGVEVTVRRDGGMLHGYLSAAGAIEVAAEAVTQAGTWIRSRMDDAMRHNAV